VERIFVQYKLFIALIILNIALIVMDILGWAFNGLPGPFHYFCNKGFNSLLYIVAPVAPSFWVLYTYHLVLSDERKIKRLRNVLAAALALNAVISVASLYTGWYFHVDAENLYHRGPLFLLYVGYCGLLLFYAFLFILVNRKQFQKKQFYAMILFFAPQVVGIALQLFHYGGSYNWSGMMVSLLIIYLNFQTSNLNTDYLTVANSRLHLQQYIKAKIRGSSGRRTFGAIMIDIDNFKHINDNFGHTTGDEALKDAVRILKDSLRRDDFIARFGGDEFIIVLDVQTQKMLEDMIQRIQRRIASFNSQSAKPYRLSFSLGYDIYDTEARMKADEYIAPLDRLMYEDKLAKRQHQPGGKSNG